MIYETLLDTTAGGGTVPTVTDNAFAQGLLASKEVGISFAPTTSTSDPNGQLTFGGVDTSKFTGPLTTVFVVFALSVAGTLTTSTARLLRPPLQANSSVSTKV